MPKGIGYGNKKKPIKPKVKPKKMAKARSTKTKNGAKKLSNTG